MFIISPRCGLCNQLQTIVKGILLGIKYNRNIYIDNFQINLYTEELCNINKILNIDKINDYLSSINITNCKILTDIDNNIMDNISEYNLPNIDYSNIFFIKSLNSTIEDNIDNNIIYLGNIVSLCIYESFNYKINDYTNLYYLILSNIIFHDDFYKMKNIIKDSLNLIDYTTIHLRIEDDAINCFSQYFKLTVDEYNKKLLLFYDNNLKNIKQNIYICSGILHYANNINYDYYINLVINNDLILDKNNIPIDNYYLNNRELIAIVDLLIAYDSNEFIGCAHSTFSLCIKSYFNCNNKYNINLFDI